MVMLMTAISLETSFNAKGVRAFSHAYAFAWAACPNTVSPQFWHLDSKKTNKEDWSQAVRDGKFTAALRALDPKKRRGPWTVLCDNEGFLRAKASMAAYSPRSTNLCSVPPKSPDLNPVEMFWGWLREKLRSMDLEDLRKKRRLLDKTAYVARVKGVLKSAKAQTVAKNVAGRLRKSCKQVVDRNGAAADN